jgi:hypothetical protein
MKKFLFAIIVLALFSGCGWIESAYDEANYESLTNETGKIEIFSGGEVLYSFPDSKIKYSSSDTDAVWFKTKSGQEIYVQPGLIIFLD